MNFIKKNILLIFAGLTSATFFGLSVFVQPTMVPWNREPTYSLFGIPPVSSIHIVPALLFLIYASITCVAGAGVLLSLAPKIKTKIPDFLRPLFFIACYPFGVLIVTALNRLTTLFFINQFAIPLAMIIFLFIAGVSYKIYMRTNFIDTNPATQKQNFYLSILSIIVAILFSLILEIHLPAIGMMGDAVNFFLRLIADNKITGVYGRVPVFPQHYDEFLYLFPFLSSKNLFNNQPIEVYWYFYSLAKSSILALFCLFSILLGGTIRRSILISWLCFFGSVYIFPLKNILIFDSDSPLFFSLHPGRIFIVGLFIALFSITYYKLDNRKPSASDCGFVFLFMLGLGAVTITFLTLLIAYFSGFFLRGARINGWQAALLFFLLVFGFLLSAALLKESPLLSSGVLLASAVISLGILFRHYLCFNKLSLRFFIRSMRFFTRKISLSIIIGLIISLLMLGNVFVKFNWVQSLLPGQHIVGDGKGVVSLSFGVNPYCGIFPHLYCASIFDFVGSYGFPFFIVISFILMIHRLNYKHNFKNSSSLLFALILYAFSIWYLVFLSQGDQNTIRDLSINIWYKTRMLEPFFYMSIFFGLMSSFKLCNNRLKLIYLYTLLLAYIACGIFVLIKLPLVLQINYLYLIHLNYEMFF